MSAPQHSGLLGGHAEPLLLFGEGDGPAEPSRRRRRQIKLAKIGRHPVSIYLRQAFSAGLRLHPLAPRQIDARPSPYRCGTCKFCEPLDADGRDFSPKTGEDYAHPDRLVWKCWRWPEKVTRGGATTIRLMWPACIRWEAPSSTPYAGCPRCGGKPEGYHTRLCATQGQPITPHETDRSDRAETPAE